MRLGMLRQVTEHPVDAIKQGNDKIVGRHETPPSCEFGHCTVQRISCLYALAPLVTYGLTFQVGVREEVSGSCTAAKLPYSTSGISLGDFQNQQRCSEWPMSYLAL